MRSVTTVPRESGWTLIETMVVLALLAITTDIAINAWANILSGSHTLEVVQGVKRLALQARHQAMLTNTPVTIQATGCTWSASYAATPPSGVQPLPPPVEAPAGARCGPDFSGTYTPNGLWVDGAQTPTAVTWSVQGAGGSKGVIVLHAGGAIDVQ